MILVIAGNTYEEHYRFDEAEEQITFGAT